MWINQTEKIARRAFLRRAGQLGLAGVATPWALNLAAIGEAAAFTATDYKAIVCVFLYGGNDHGNTLVPFDNANYAKYAAIRTGIATPQASLAATVLAPADLDALADVVQAHRDLSSRKTTGTTVLIP